jgi:hypothetical protein
MSFPLARTLLRLYSKSSLTLNEWRFNLSFSWVSMLFLNSQRVSSHRVRYNTNPPTIQKQQWHSSEAQNEPPLTECECEWAFRIRALDILITVSTLTDYKQLFHLFKRENKSKGVYQYKFILRQRLWHVLDC